MARKKTQPKHEKITDEQLVNMIEQGVEQSVGDWLNSSDLTRERLKATYEYAGVAEGHLAPEGVSGIVDTSTTEIVEAYTAIISDLFLSNKKLAKFTSFEKGPQAQANAFAASDITNYCLFKSNPGWAIMNDWFKSALLWKNGIVRWDYVEDYEYTYEEYDSLSQMKVDELLSDDNVEVIGNLKVENQVDLDLLNQEDPNAMQQASNIMYVDVRIRRKTDMSGVKIKLVPQENVRISRDATAIDDAQYVGVQFPMSRSEIRKQWPAIADSVEDWDELGDVAWNTKYTEEQAARKQITGQEYWQGSNDEDIFPLEANREVNVIESWVRVDRDGDGIAELKRVITSGSTILHEEDVDFIRLASLVPISIPHEFYGLSMADFTRSSTLASTAILRGFVENTYLTNYSPKLADPNVVDFAALQSMGPKDIVPTNGNPAAAVHPMPPETIASGTVPLLQHLQLIKEQATGMSKAAQGLQSELFVSGNSEQKLSSVQAASQKRIQHIARLFAETGVERLVKGVYRCMRQEMKMMKYVNAEGVYGSIDPSTLPRDMDIEIMVDVGENSNANLILKNEKILKEIIPMVEQSGKGIVLKSDAPATALTGLLVAMGTNPGDIMKDIGSPEFQQEMEQQAKTQQEESMKTKEIEQQKLMAERDLAHANINYTNQQSNNAFQDNAKQFAVSMDKHYQDWEELKIKAIKEGAPAPQPPNFEDMMKMAMAALQGMQMFKSEVAMPTPQPQEQAGPVAPGPQPGQAGPVDPNAGGAPVG